MNFKYFIFVRNGNEEMAHGLNTVHSTTAVVRVYETTKT
jgi:hypothetical protein